MGTKALNEEQMGQVIKTLNKYLGEHFTKQEQRHEMRRDEDYDDETEDQLLDEVNDPLYFFQSLRLKFFLIFNLKDDFDALILSKISDIVHSLFKVYKLDFMQPFEQLVPHFVHLLVIFPV